jgi:hypothetical protein
MNDDDLLRSMCVEAGAAGYIGRDDQVWQLHRCRSKQTPFSLAIILQYILCGGDK